MTEEIIIDGVNVKDCKRRIGKNSYCRYFKRPCAENNFNCVWKQKVRLEQENKELKEKVKELDKMTGIFSARLCDKYRSTLEEIQKAIKSYDLTVDNGASVDTLYTIRKFINEVLK